MRKLKLLLASFALLVGGVNYVCAQATYNHTYTEGVLVTEGSNYFLYNIESNTFFSGGMDWGTRAAGDHSGKVVTLTASDGKYTIKSAFFSSNNNDTAEGYLTKYDEPYADNNTTADYESYTFTLADVAGYTNAYTIKNGDKFLYYNTVDTRINWGDTEHHWLIIPKTVRDAAGDFTYYLQNQGMNRPWQRAIWGGVGMWTSDWSNSQGDYWGHGGNGDNPCAEKYKGSEGKDFVQTITSSLPAGRYRLSVQGFFRQESGSETAPNLYIGNSTKSIQSLTGTENSMTDASTSFSAGKYVNSVEAFLDEATENVKIGINVTGTNQWTIWDNFNLDYLGQCVMDYAVELPDGGAMAADTWYYFDVAAAADNYLATATTLGDIICTTDGYTLTSAATGDVTLTATDNSFTAQRYYVKSSSANNLEIGVAAYSYSVSAATADVSYIQSGKTVTVSYTVNTNDPDAVLSQDYSGITFDGDAIIVTPTASGFTFTVPTVTSNTDYTLSIPANAIGYASGSTYNAAQEITLHTPAVFDGTCYLYDATNKLFLSRGKNYGSRAVVDLYGLPISITTDGENASLITFLDWPGKYMFFDNSNHADCWLYTDGDNSKGDERLFTLTATTGGYYLRDAAKAVYIRHDNSALNVPTTNEAEAIVWTLMSKTDHDAIVDAYPTTNKTNVITAAGISTTAGNFETYLALNYAAKDKTSSVGTAKFAGEIGDWTWTKVTGDDATYGTDYTEGYQNAGTWSQTISGLTAGIYKVTVNGFERKAHYGTCNTLGAEGYEPVTAYFKANNEQLPLKSWYSDKTGENYPNWPSEAATAFNNDLYKNTIYTYVTDTGDDAGKLTLTIGKQDKADGSWLLFNNVTLTFYDSSITDDEATAIITEAETEMTKPMKHSLYQALATAKTTFSGAKTVPNYNTLRTAIDNTATSIASYATMKTNYLDKIAAVLATTNFIDQTSSEYTIYKGYKDAYEKYTEAGTADVENATANSLSVTEGDGTEYTSTYSKLLLPNWKIGETPALTNSSKFYVNTWSDENEGGGDAKDFANPFFEKADYPVEACTLTGTMTGLTANGYYAVTANVRVAGNDKVKGSITMQVGSGLAVDVTEGSKIGTTDRYIAKYTAYGQADSGGKLTVTITVANGCGINWLSFRDVNYAAVETEDVQIADASGFATYASNNNLDYSSVNGLKAYKAEISGTTITFTPVSKVPAGEGVLLKGDAATYKVFTATDATSIAPNAFVRGTGAEVQTTNGSYHNYILSKKSGVVGFYQAAGKTVPTNRAYIQSSSATSRLDMVFDDDETTGISTIKNSQVTMPQDIYDLQGRRVETPTKGLYIMGGKKVIFK